MTDAIEAACADGASKGLFHGVVVAAGTPTSVDVLRAWGQASMKPEARPMTTLAVFDVASLTKAVAVATACGLCIDRELLDPDAPITDYLPTAGCFPKHTIRVADLATHGSGYFNVKLDETPPEQLVQKSVEAPPTWLPGERFEYSCRNFIVLGHLVEVLMGQPLARFCRCEIFDPLRMNDTVFGPLREDLARVVPSEQRAGTISDRQARKADRPIGNAGLFSTAEDLAAFCRMMLWREGSPGPRLLGDAARRWLTRPCSRPHLARRCFGWSMQLDAPDRPSAMSEAAFGHGGSTGQSMWIDPERGVYTVVLTNRTHEATVDNYEPSKAFRAELANLLIEVLKANDRGKRDVATPE